MIILPPGLIDEENIRLLRENEICVVVAKDPAKVRFVDPIPAVASRTKMEQAAIALSRKILAQGFWTNDSTRQTVAMTYVDLLVKGTPLDPEPSQEDLEKQAYDNAKLEEMRCIAREDARAERAKKKLAGTPTPAK
jgi:hypothetical protein